MGATWPAAGAVAAGPAGASAGGAEDGAGGDAAWGAQAIAASKRQAASVRTRWVAIVPPVRRHRRTIAVLIKKRRAGVLRPDRQRLNAPRQTGRSPTRPRSFHPLNSCAAIQSDSRAGVKRFEVSPRSL